MADLDAAEREALDSVLGRIREEWGFPAAGDLAHLITRWARTVAEVERGYELTPGDFIHDLDLRDALNEVELAVPERLQKAIQDEVKPLDARFFAATLPSAKSLIPTSEGEAPKSWWFRIPAKVNEIEPGGWQNFLI